MSSINFEGLGVAIAKLTTYTYEIIQPLFFFAIITSILTIFFYYTKRRELFNTSKNVSYSFWSVSLIITGISFALGIVSLSLMSLARYRYLIDYFGLTVENMVFGFLVIHFSNSLLGFIQIFLNFGEDTLQNIYRIRRKE
jgi:hypothetical protein